MQKTSLRINRTKFTNKSLRNPEIAFVGLTHLGLVVSISWASFNSHVLAIDKDKATITKLEKGVLETSEPGLRKLFDKVKKYFHPTTDFSTIKNASLIFITFDTPTDKPTSLTTLNKLISAVIPNIADNANLIIMSQIPVGFCRKLYHKIKKQRPSLNFHLYYLLNTLVVGNALDRFLNPERIVVGKSNIEENLPEVFKQSLQKLTSKILEMTYESAEMTKTAVNLFLASSITTANTLADFCEMTGADIHQIIPALKLDKRIGQFAYLNPTLRISGGHLERELTKLKKLSKQLNMPSGIVDSLINLNEGRINWAKKHIKGIINSTPYKPVIAIWGISYKKNTNSTENSASLKIIEYLSGKVILNIYDPVAKIAKSKKKINQFKDKYQALKNADCLLILTDWDEFAKINVIKMEKLMRQKNIIDSVGILYQSMNLLNNFRYICMGVG